jgi:EmrB/QacA subfamily drug resistance transporter
MPEKKPVHENLILAVVLVAVLMAAIDSTIVLLAFPAIVSSLHSNLTTIIWVILIYMLISAVAMTQFGKIGDIYGRSRIFMAGLVVFTIASFLCGLAPTDILLIVFRAMQGLGGAMISATSGAIIADTFERHRIGRAFGYTAMAYNVGAILGIVLGGVITTFIGWQYIFFINVPIGIVALILGIKYISDKQTFAAKLDILGMVTLAVSLSLLLYGGIGYASTGIGALNVGLVVLGALLLVAFYFVEKRAESPTIPLDMFENKIFRNSIFAALLQGLGFLGVVFMLIMYLQGVRGLTPLYASLLLVPGYVVSGIVAPYMGRVSDKRGARIVATVGITLQILGIIVYLFLGPSSSIYIVILGSLITGMGGAMFWPSNSSAIMAHAEQRRFGIASGLSRLFSTMGMMGSFIIVFVVAAFSIPRSQAFQIFVGTSTKLTGSVANAFVTGMHYSFVAMIVVLLVAGIISWSRGKEDRTAKLHHPQPKSPTEEPYAQEPPQ